MSLLSSCYSGMFTVFPVFRRKARDTTAPSLAPRLQRKMREGFPRNKWKLAARVTSVCKLAPTSWHLRAVRILALGDRLPVRVPKATTTRTNKWFANEKWQRNENFFFFFFCTKLVSFAVIWLALSDSFFFFTCLEVSVGSDNRPFYSCVLSCLAIEWKWGWSWPCFDWNLPAFLMLMLFSC